MRPSPSRLVLATKNPGKVREILQICSDWPVTWLTDQDAVAQGLGWPEVEETGRTYLENALLKARAAANATGLPALADDSGIEVDALGGKPGIHSARFAGQHASDQENLRLVVERITEVPPEARTARYRCIAACAWPDGRHRWAEGECEGLLILEPRGSGGFGYDPVFVPQGGDRTMSELSPERKNAISHRGRAFGALRALLFD